MAAYARAHVMKNAVITIDSVEYANQCTKALFEPDAPTQTLRTLVPDGNLTDVDTPTWTLQLAGIQDRGVGSLGAALDAAVGDDIEIVVQPKAGTGQDVGTATIRVSPIPFGGEQGQFRTFDSTFAVIGQPVFSQSA